MKDGEYRCRLSVYKPNGQALIMSPHKDSYAGKDVLFNVLGPLSQATWFLIDQQSDRALIKLDNRRDYQMDVAEAKYNEN